MVERPKYSSIVAIKPVHVEGVLAWNAYATADAAADETFTAKCVKGVEVRMKFSGRVKEIVLAEDQVEALGNSKSMPSHRRI